MDLRFFYIKQTIEEKDINIKYVSSNENRADGLTKLLGSSKQREAVTMFRLRTQCP